VWRVLVRPFTHGFSTTSSGVRPAAAEDDAPGPRGPGTLLLDGKYRLDHLLAVGGMSSVWRATHVTLGRSVAVKFIDVQSHDRDKTVERFLREARLAATIHHPNVIDVVDFGIAQNGEPLMVMELLEGETLSQRIEAEPRLTTREVVQVMSQVLGALEAVHHAGILHCDMKPDNVVLGAMSDASDIFAWLIDFGIAYSIDPTSELTRGRFGTDLQLVSGTPEYMAPEQAEGRTDLDERVDVYASSVMLYELFAGTCPFTDDLPGRVLFKVIDGKHVPLRTLRPDIGELADVVQLGMSHDRDARPASARELRRLLLQAARPRSLVVVSTASEPALPLEPTPQTLHLPDLDAPALARTSPEPPVLLRAEREACPAAEEASGAVTSAAPRWLVALGYWLALVLIAVVVYVVALEPARPVTLSAHQGLAPSRALPRGVDARPEAVHLAEVREALPLPMPAEPSVTVVPEDDRAEDDEVFVIRGEPAPERRPHAHHASAQTVRAIDEASVPAADTEELDVEVEAPAAPDPAPAPVRPVVEFVEDPGF
jgi:serine/threonine protein kinase